MRGKYNKCPDFEKRIPKACLKTHLSSSSSFCRKIRGQQTYRGNDKEGNKGVSQFQFNGIVINDKAGIIASAQFKKVKFHLQQNNQIAQRPVKAPIAEESKPLSR